jgi:branched-chain amino acid transport system substrate-binding protein
MGDAAVGILLSSMWEPSLDNPVSKKFTAEYTAKYKREPSEFAAGAYDAAQLLGSALKKTNGNVSDKKALMAAIKQADFKSLRGNFKFNTNQFPIVDWHVFEVVKDPKDGKTHFAYRATPLTAHKDAYYDKCPMK